MCPEIEDDTFSFCLHSSPVLIYFQLVCLNFIDGVISGGIAGVVAETSLYPIDTIKTRLLEVCGGGKIVLKGLYNGWLEILLVSYRKFLIFKLVCYFASDLCCRSKVFVPYDVSLYNTAVSYLAADSLFPEWKIWTQFLDQTIDGLRLDGLAESHPIEVDINHASEIDEIFYAISYKKVPLLSGCYKAISKFACSNARTEDLWVALEEGSGEPVNMLMNSWTKQMGYPVISVKLKDNKLEFDQSQFLQSGASGNGQWIVPITLYCGSYEAHKNFLLQSKSESLDVVKLLGSSDVKGNHKQWIKLNVDQAGFYRVKYDDDLQARIRYAIEASSLFITDRFGVLDDSYALFMACKQSLSSLFVLMTAYRKELDYTVLSHLITISFSSSFDSNSTLFDAFTP
ncbi:hypothetical protein MKX01_025237 [Papaver californicum]|nr:hypothetical protein MKX01_025237 [Papaver californicum]